MKTKIITTRYTFDDYLERKTDTGHSVFTRSQRWIICLNLGFLLFSYDFIRAASLPVWSPLLLINNSLCCGGEGRGRKHRQESIEISGLHKKARCVLLSQSKQKELLRRHWWCQCPYRTGGLKMANRHQCFPCQDNWGACLKYRVICPNPGDSDPVALGFYYHVQSNY